MPADGAREAHPAAGELLGDQHVAGGGDRVPAVRFRDRRSEQAETLHLVDELVRVLVRVLEVADGGAHVVVNELAGDGNGQAFLFAQNRHSVTPIGWSDHAG